MREKKDILFFILGGFFISNALVAEFIGVKIFSLEKTIGILPFEINLFGIENLSFNFTAGVLLWPIVFVMTDIINEYFGKKGVRLISYTTAILIAYAYVMIYFSMNLAPSDFWIFRETSFGKINMDVAFNTIFSQGNWIIIGSLVAFLIGQIVDVTVFRYLRKITGSSKIWFRATGSTLVSQLIDSFVVLFIAFYIGSGWSFNQVIAIAIVNYIYKFFIAILMTPLLYLIHNMIDKFLGKELANQMVEEAMEK